MLPPQIWYVAVPWSVRQIAETDRNGKLASGMPGLANWASGTSNNLTRPVMEAVAGVRRMEKNAGAVHPGTKAGQPARTMRVIRSGREIALCPSRCP